MNKNSKYFSRPRDLAAFLVIGAALAASVLAGTQRQAREIPGEFDLIRLLDLRMSESEEGRQLEMSLAVGNRQLDLLLDNSELFTPGGNVVWLEPAGAERVENSNALFLSGSVRGDDSSNVRLAVYGGVLEGVIVEKGEIHLIEPAQRYFPNLPRSEILMHRLSDLSQIWTQGACGVDHTGGLTDGRGEPESNFMTQTSIAPGFDPQGADQGTRIVEMRLVVDSHYSARYGAVSADRVHSIIHQVSGILQNQLGVTLRVSQTVVWLGQDAYGSSNTDSTRLLKTFAESRPLEETDLAHLFTARPLSDGVLGYARIGGICSSSSGVALSLDVQSSASRLVLAAHEIGHNLGARHDGGGKCLRTSNGFIMWPYLDSQARSFSSCSRKGVADRMKWASCANPVSTRPVSAPTPIAPRGAVVSRGLRFEWLPVEEEVEGYFIEVYDENEAKFIVSKTVQGSTWTPDLTLSENSTYRWRIAASLNDGLGQHSEWKSFAPYPSRWAHPRR